MNSSPIVLATVFALGATPTSGSVTLEQRGAIVASTSAVSSTAAEFSVNGDLERIQKIILSGPCVQQTVRNPGMRETPPGVSVPGIFTYRFTRWFGTHENGAVWVALFDDENSYRVPTGITLTPGSNGQVKVTYFPHNPGKALEIRASIEDGTYFCKWTKLQALPNRYIQIN